MENKIVAMGYIIFENGILMIHHKKKNRLMSCGGKIEPNETLINGLKREIKEELNLDVDILSYYGIDDSEAQPLPINYLIKTIDKECYEIFEFVCRANNLEKLKLKEDEIIRIELIKSQNVLENNNLNGLQKKTLTNIFEKFIDPQKILP